MKKQLKILALFTLLSAVYSYIFFIRKGVAHGDDIVFQISSLIGLNNVFSSPVNFTTFLGGVPMTHFFPWLTLLPAVFLMKMVGILTGYRIFIFLLTLLTLYLAYYAIKKMYNEKAGLVFAILYTFAAYRSTDIFVRFAVTEAVAIAFLPLVFYGAYELFFGDMRRWPILALGLALVTYSEPIFALYSLMLMVIAGATQYKRFIKEDDLKKASLYTLGASLLLTARYSLPFLQELSHQNLSLPNAEVMREAVNIVFTGLIDNDIYKKTAGLAALIAMVWLFFKHKTLSKPQRFSLYTGLLLIVATTVIFPWPIFSFANLNDLRFATRLNAFASLFIFSAFASYFSQIKSYRNSTLILTVALSLLHLGTVNTFYKTLPLEQYGIIYQNDQDLTGFMSLPIETSDYLNTRANTTKVRNRTYTLKGKEVKIREKITENSISFMVLNTTKDEIPMVMPIYRYAGQDVTVNGKTVKTSLTKEGLTEIQLDAGESKVEISYHYTFLTHLASLISLVAFLAYPLSQVLDLKPLKKDRTATVTPTAQKTVQPTPKPKKTAQTSKAMTSSGPQTLPEEKVDKQTQSVKPKTKKKK